MQWLGGICRALRAGGSGAIESVHAFVNLVRSCFGCSSALGEGKGLTSHLPFVPFTPGRATSRRGCYHLAMAQMSDDLASILANAGGVFLIPYLTARGITSAALLARVAATEDALVASLATPFITDWQASDGTNFQANASDALLVQAALTVAWEDARVARARAFAPVTTEPAPAASPQQVAERLGRVPTNLLPGQWSALVDAYNTRFAPAIRAFPEERLMGAESFARMLYELKTSRCFTPLELGEIIGKRAFSADGAPNRIALAQAESSTGMRIAMDGTFTQVTPQHTPTSAMQILDALEAIRAGRKSFARTARRALRCRWRTSSSQGCAELLAITASRRSSTCGWRGHGASLSRCAKASRSTRSSPP